MSELIAGVDEAGRGPLAGPVTVAAVILDPDCPIPGLADSKALSASRRAQLAEQIRERALAFVVVALEAAEIDQLNILAASLEGMRRATAALRPQPLRALVDGNKIPPNMPCPTEAIVKGDSKIQAISAASILAKTQRDAEMVAADVIYPGYGFAIHKGYPTADHLAALKRLGPCPIHRRSFAPVRAALSVDLFSESPGPRE